jgi:hypothetical protein
MTEHALVLELAVAALDFPLSPGEERQVSEHLAGCEMCRNKVGALRADRERLGAVAVLAAPVAVRQHVLAAALDTSSRVPSTRRRLLVLAMVLLLIGLAAASVAVGSRLLEFFMESRLPAPTSTPVPSNGASVAPSLAPSAAPTATPEGEWVGYRQVVGEAVLLRAQAKAGTEVLADLPPVTVVSAWNTPVVVDGDEWQLVHYGELAGWVSLDTPSGAALSEVQIWSPGPPLLRVDVYPDVIGDLGTLTFAVSGEGRLIRPDAVGFGWTEQWLTAAGVELLRTTAIDSGLLDATVSYPPPGDWQAGFTTTRISILGWNGPVTVMATNAGGGPEADAVVALGEQLEALAETLPENAIVDPGVPPQPYVVSAFNLLVGPSEGVLATWPDDEVAAIPLWIEDATLPLERPLLETGELLPGQDLRCSVIDAASAAALREALWAAGFDAQPGSDVLASFTLGWREANGVVSVDINAVPPGDAADCTRYGAEPVNACVDSPDLDALLGMTDPLGCYGDANLTFQGWLAPIGAYDPVLFVEPAWLCCPYYELRASPGPGSPAHGEGLWLVFSPASGINLGDFTETPVRLTGHFDDPAAQECQYTEDYSHLGVLPGDAVIGCRRTFVVTDIESVAL